MQDTKTRSIVKALSWRILGTCVTIVIVYFLTGHLAFSLAAGGIDSVAKLIIYFFHERIWEKVKWGRK